MIRSTAGRSSVKGASGSAYAAGATGIVASSLLIAVFALQASHPEDGVSLGPARVNPAVSTMLLFRDFARRMKGTRK